jgi:hypothetical protein
MLGVPSGPGQEDWMTFTFKLEHEDGTPADPPTFKTAVPDWRSGDTIPLGPGRTLRVIETRPGTSPDEDLVLVVKSA